MAAGLPNVIALNLHRRFTGISSTVKFLLPHQRRELEIGLIDWGSLQLGGNVTLWTALTSGFRRPDGAAFRVWHARRDIDMLFGILLRDVLRQRWRLVFTSAANRTPGRVLGFLINRMDVVVAACERCTGFLGWHSTVIHHGTDTTFFRPEDGSRHSGPVPKLPGKFVVGTLGRVRHTKGTDLFVDALIELLPEFEDFSAVVAGLCRPKDGGFKADLEERIARAGLRDRIVFVGDLESSEAASLLRRVDLCVAPSRVEGFGLTAIEAFASGTPVVASSVGVWPEIVGHQVGAVFESGNLNDLIDKLRPLLASPERLAGMGAAARRQAVERHSVAGEAEALNDLYKRLMSGESLARVASSAETVRRTLKNTTSGPG